MTGTKPRVDPIETFNRIFYREPGLVVEGVATFRVDLGLKEATRQYLRVPRGRFKRNCWRFLRRVLGKHYIHYVPLTWHDKEVCLRRLGVGR